MSGCRWKNESLNDAFHQGLSDCIKDELVARDSPNTLKGLEQLATRIDHLLQEQRRDR